MAAARLTALLEGDHEKRSAAFGELTALANGDDVDATTNLSTASVHVGGLDGELEDEEKLAEMFGRFGTVVAVTLRTRNEVQDGEQVVSWSLLTFAEEEEARKAVAGAEELGGALVVRSLDTQQALGSSGAMGQVMRTHRARVKIGVAAACVAPLIKVLCADLSDVGVVEYQTASLLLGELICLDPVQVGAEMVRDGRGAAVYSASGNAIKAIAAKQPEELTREDAMTAACDMVPMCAIITRGMGKVAQGAGCDEMAVFASIMAYPFFITQLQTHELNEALALRLGELCRDPQGVSETVLAGAYFACMCALSQRPTVATAVWNAGAVQLAVSTLQESSPTEWIAWSTPTGLLASGILGWVTNIFMVDLGDVDKPQALLDSGCVDAFISAMRAYELGGSRKIDEASPATVVCAVYPMGIIDLTAPSAAPILQRLRDIPSTLRFILDNPLVHMEFAGVTTASCCAQVTALAFGKDEGGGYDFTQELVGSVVKMQLTTYTSSTSPTALRSVLHLCISDANKVFLVHSPALVPLLLDTSFTAGFLLGRDPGLFAELTGLFQGEDDEEKIAAQRDQHATMTKDQLAKMTQHVKEGIQADAAECFLQLALYEPGKKLLEGNPAVLDALRAMCKTAFTEEAQLSAEGALLALEGRQREPEPELAGGADADISLHVMISYQWDVQEIIQRVVDSLRLAGYLVWFDLDNMKGSTMDAMSDAIDNAEVMLFGVSLAYKESGNCRLEANYAHQQEVEMIPLMVQKDYKAKGWLGLILGSALWYPFFDCEDEDDTAFEKRLVPVKRAIGERGKPKSKASTEEGVPPLPSTRKAPAPASAAPKRALSAAPARPPAPAPAPAPAPTPTPVAVPTTPRAQVALTQPTHDHGFSPSMQAVAPSATSSNAMAIAPSGPTVGAPGLGIDSSVIAFMREERDFMAAQMKEQKEEVERQRKEMERQMKGQKEETERQRKEMEANLSPAAAISGEQLIRVQARLEKLHAAKLLTDDELFAMEDLCADVIEFEASGGTLTMEACANHAVAKARKLAALSEKMPADAAFSRQLRRKFL